MKAKHQLISSLSAAVLILFLSFNAFAQNTEGKSKLDIEIDRNGEKIRIDTLIESSNLPKLLEELNLELSEEMPKMFEDLQLELQEGLPQLEEFFNNIDGNGITFDFKQFDNLFDEEMMNSFDNMFKEFENLNLENLNLGEAFQGLDKMLKDLDLNIQEFNFDGFENFEFGDIPSRKNKAQLGVTLSEKEENGKKSITVNGITKGSLAEKAGILKGDKITQIDGKKAENIMDVVNGIQRKKDKEILKIGIERNGIPTTLEIEMNVPKPEKVKETIKKV